MSHKIFIVDDDEVTRELIALVLKKNGYEVTGFITGKELINNSELPSLFMVDRHLIFMDGLEVCRILKADEKKKDIPVIIISANPDVEALYINAGADDFIQKPFDVTDLVKTVTKHLT